LRYLTGKPGEAVNLECQTGIGTSGKQPRYGTDYVSRPGAVTTVRYLGIEVDDALAKAEQVDV
jgi:hypothetical protein